VTARTFAPLVGVSHVTVLNRREKGELLAVKSENGSFLFPVWQVQDGRVLKGLPEVIRAMKHSGAEDIAILGFFLEAHDSLQAQRPLDILRTGDIESVLEAASTWGGHGSR
jgi:hypothetical protein